MPVQDHPYHATSNIPVTRLATSAMMIITKPGRNTTRRGQQHQIPSPHPHRSDDYWPYIQSVLQYVISTYYHHGHHQPHLQRIYMRTLRPHVGHVQDHHHHCLQHGRVHWQQDLLWTQTTNFLLHKKFLPSPVWGYYAIEPAFIILLDGKARDS